MKFTISVYDKNNKRTRYHIIKLNDIEIDDFFYFLDSFSNFLNNNVYLCDYGGKHV